jgi:hypothetical protein
MKTTTALLTLLSSSVLSSSSVLAAPPSLSSSSPAIAPPSVPPCPSAQEKPDVALLTRRTEALLRGRSTTGTMVMTIKTPSWTRTLKVRTQAMGDDKALIKVLEGGPRETGMMTLKRDGQLWNWLPRAARVMKVPSGMLGDSWMGSDFTNDDLVQGSSIARDFDAMHEGVIDHQGRSAWRIALVPKKTAAVVWGRVELIVDRATCNPLEQRFFDEDGVLARRMTFGDFAQVGWRSFPRRMTVQPEDQSRSTTIQYEDIAFDVDIPEDTFSLHRLQQGR